MRERLGYAATPQIVLLNASESNVGEWIGVVDEATLATGLDDLLRR